MKPDPRFPSRDLLLRPQAAEVLDVALAHEGGRCRTARPSQVRYVPGSSLTIQYRATVDWGDGSETGETLVVQDARELPDGTTRLGLDDREVAVWRYPNDPYLPGLAPANDGESVLGILNQLGVSHEDVTLRRRAYRPGRRAVIEALSSHVRLFLKVVRPSRVKRLQEIHSVAAGAVPVPRSFGWTEGLGLVVIQAMPGQTLRKAIADGEGSLPGGLELVGLLDGLAGVSELDETAGPVDRLGDHRRLLSTVLPGAEERINALVSRIEVAETAPSVVHGDFHTSQVITEAGKVVGLIDLDTLGIGSRSDDLATMLAQISALALNEPSYREYGEALINEFDLLVDPADLRFRTAAALVGFATGPFRVQMVGWEQETEERLALAESWVESAEMAV